MIDTTSISVLTTVTKLWLTALHHSCHHTWLSHQSIDTTYATHTRIGGGSLFVCIDSAGMMNSACIWAKPNPSAKLEVSKGQHTPTILGYILVALCAYGICSTALLGLSCSQTRTFFSNFTKSVDLTCVDYPGVDTWTVSMPTKRWESGRRDTEMTQTVGREAGS